MVMCEGGEVSDGKLELNDAGQTSDDEWHRIPERYGCVILDTYQVMPNIYTESCRLYSWKMAAGNHRFRDCRDGSRARPQ